MSKVNPLWDRHSWDRSRLSVLERSLVEITWHHQFVKLNLFATRTLLQRHPLLLALEIRSRNEEAINSTRNSIYLLKVLLLPISTDVDNFYLCLSWSSTRVRLYACTNTRKFKGLDSRELYTTAKDKRKRFTWHVISIIEENKPHAHHKIHLKVYNTRPLPFC